LGISCFRHVFSPRYRLVGQTFRLYFQHMLIYRQLPDKAESSA
jgi:hypothetical protein